LVLVAVLIAAAILALLIIGGVYWWTTRLSEPVPEPTAGPVFTGTPADRIELSPGALKDWNVLLISADTLRADHVGCYGNTVIRTPAIDGLARRGVLFRKAVTPVPITLPGHASMLTGLNPPRHGVRSNGFFRLRAETGTLGLRLKPQGYVTGAVVGAYVLDKRFGLNQGFDHYDDDMTRGQHPTTFGFSERRAEQVNEVAIEWLHRHARQKFFLFVHYFDPHAPYAPPSPWDQVYKNNPYGGEIAYVDSQVGRLLAVLDELNLRQRTLVIFTSDHGESLGEHGESTHALLIYDATQLVPLIFSAPPPFPQNRIVTHQAGLIDIVPTVLALLGMSGPEKLDGISLLEPPPSRLRPMYIETLYTRLTHNWAPLLGVRRNDYKFIHAPKPEVYDLQADPRELNNLYAAKPDVAAEMFATLRELLGGDPDTARDVKGNLPVDEKTRQMLQAVGYVVPSTSIQAATEPTSLPDPKDMVLASHQLVEAQTRMTEGRWKEASELIRAYLEVSPNDPEGAHVAGLICRQLGQYDDALRHFTRAAAMGYQQAESLSGMASIYVVRKDLGKAEELYKKALQIDPHNTTALLGLGSVYGEQKREAEAMQAFQDAIRYGQRINTGMAYVGISNLHRKAGRLAEAREALAKAVEAEPSNPVIARIAASFGEQTGDVGTTIEHLRKAAEDRPTAEGLLKLGRLLNQQKRYHEAAQYLGRAMTLGPPGADLHYELGIALVELRQIDQAAQQFNRAIQLAPNHTGALSQLGMLLARAGRFEDAEKLMSRIIQIDPNSPVAHYNLGLVLANLEAYDRAAQHLRKAIELNPNDPQARTKLGLVLAQQGKTAEATQQYREALRIDPNHTEAKELLQIENAPK